MKKFLVMTGVFVFAAVIGGAWYSHDHRGSMLDQRLAECGAIPNGATKTVADTSRLFINVPKDIYPDIHLTITPYGATALYISNAGPYGEAIGAQGKPNCWSYYFEFALTPNNPNPSGTVDISSKSAVAGVPDYRIHFFVTKDARFGNATSSSAIRKNDAGLLRGTVTLGPTCPIERIPPSPQCANKPYQTSIAISSVSDPSHASFSARSDAAGAFSILLPPGQYTLSAGGSNLPRCNRADAAVAPGATTSVSIFCDTGIR